MCAICGILGKGTDQTAKALDAMRAVMKSRGPDQSGTYMKDNVAFAHNRLAIIDVEHGVQPMTRTYLGRSYTIVYNGELYNTAELTETVRKSGVQPETYCDTEIVLYLYILFGKRCAAMLNGIYAFAIYDESRHEVYLARDRFGIKPLFYTDCGGTLVFASELKALLQYPGVRPVVDQEGLWELIFLTPMRLGGIFKGIDELQPAHHAVWSEQGLKIERYWTLEAKECTDARDEIIAKTREILIDAINRQLISDVPLCTLLSGGLDSSIISAVAAESYRQQGKTLSTYSFEYEGNRENFKSSLFQPQSDDEYARYMADWLRTDHRVLTAPTDAIVELLGTAALARDFPGQADIDSSLLYFCREIKARHTVAISGECADEIFGGYPWFYRPEMLENPFYPWIHDPMMRASLFKDCMVKRQAGYEYLQEQYQTNLRTCPVLDSDDAEMRTSRIATWLSVNHFMTSLLERKDRMSMAASVEVRVPFADHRILEYVYNVPWQIKFENKTEKALLRNAMADWLPEKTLNRKKSPYPKTQNPAFAVAVKRLLGERIGRPNSVLREMLDVTAFAGFLRAEDETWFGQLMAKPQLLAWLLQFDLWAESYHVDFAL